jgi:hypothetical protein
VGDVELKRRAIGRAGVSAGRSRLMRVTFWIFDIRGRAARYKDDVEGFLAGTALEECSK